MPRSEIEYNENGNPIQSNENNENAIKLISLIAFPKSQKLNSPARSCIFLAGTCAHARWCAHAICGWPQSWPPSNPKFHVRP